MNTNTDVNHPWLKWATSTGAAVGANVADKIAEGGSWAVEHAAQVSAMFATFYTFLLIVDWFWKRWGKPFLLRRGLIAGKPRDYMNGD